METDLPEYRKVLLASAPQAGSRKSNFSLCEYRETIKQRKLRSEEDGYECMDFTRYVEFHTKEVQPASERMTKSEAQTAWLKDLQGPDFERRSYYSKKSGKVEERDFVWQLSGLPKRFKKREEEHEKSAGRAHHTNNGSDSAFAEVRRRLAASQFINLDADETEFRRSWVSGFNKDDIELCGAGAIDSAAALNHRNKAKPRQKKDKLYDVTFLRTPCSRGV